MNTNIEKKHMSRRAELEELYAQKERIEQRINELHNSEIKLHEISQLASNWFDIPYSLLVSDDRHEKVVYVRTICAHEMRKRGYTLKEIGDELNRDHSTIVHSVTEYKLRYNRPGFDKFTDMAEEFSRILENYEKTLNI